MELSQIPAIASALAAEKNGDVVKTAMLKKALDNEVALAVGILQALPANPNIGRNVNTSA